MSDAPAEQHDSIPGPSGALTPGTRMATLARDLSDFLVEFSIVLHKRALYPHGHPHLQESAARFVSRLESLLEHRDGLTIGIARHQLIIGGVATDARNALLSDLARRLHRQRIASIRFKRGAGLDEIDGLLRNLSGELGEETGPLGLQLERAASWQHIQLQAPELGRLLLNEDGDEGTEEAPLGSADELWVGLANLALSADGQSSPEGVDPLLVARAIDDQVGQVAYDRVVLDYLGQMAEEISGRAGSLGTASPRARLPTGGEPATGDTPRSASGRRRSLGAPALRAHRIGRHGGGCRARGPGGGRGHHRPEHLHPPASTASQVRSSRGKRDQHGPRRGGVPSPREHRAADRATGSSTIPIRARTPPSWKGWCGRPRRRRPIEPDRHRL